MTARYREISLAPRYVRWDVPPQHQGQTIEVAYADAHPSAHEAGSGARYKRVTDQSIAVGDQGRVTYYERVMP